MYCSQQSGMRIVREYPEIRVFPVISAVFQTECFPFEEKQIFFLVKITPIHFIVRRQKP
jgi:hypothetical protein